jgi:pRiA4b ORF-3-like protein
MALKPKGNAPHQVYQLHITLKGIRPPIWRRVQVPATIRLNAFHTLIQTVFGWTDTHLHQFFIGGTSYGQPDDFDEVVEDESAVTLAHAVGTGIKRFLYVYDFGDDWEHDVEVEKIIAGNSGSERPVCLDGRRHRPPEDCGGPPGYNNFLAALRDPSHEEHDAMLEWVGGSFDAEAFDLAAVNRMLVTFSAAGRQMQ